MIVTPKELWPSGVSLRSERAFCPETFGAGGLCGVGEPADASTTSPLEATAGSPASASNGRVI
eukprot:CAMPEP_0183481204 /NCGR_PEP_ID=MMETSP0370-20130417/174518_1 /TAXON_ID=268820 /ORGANISM="Peridinium aciculiferum, Strain PAER-2" /LENGTH=62 /DNA_ID=CAMNT_0025674317 /DNA_START=23 /DNA_END=211 /DNA_ORIENTATION=+